MNADVEVTLRNTIHDRSTSYFGRDDWSASTDLVLDDITSEVVRRHRKQLAKGTIGPGKVIADLMLGTWVMLLGRAVHPRWAGPSTTSESVEAGPALRFRHGQPHPVRPDPSPDA